MVVFCKHFFISLLSVLVVLPFVPSLDASITEDWCEYEANGCTYYYYPVGDGDWGGSMNCPGQYPTWSYLGQGAFGGCPV